MWAGLGWVEEGDCQLAGMALPVGREEAPQEGLRQPLMKLENLEHVSHGNMEEHLSKEEGWLCLLRRWKFAEAASELSEGSWKPDWRLL